MKTLDFYLDAVSPYTYLAFEQLPQALEGHSVVVNYRPVLLAGLLQHWGSKGPAEIEPKREWTYRQVAWLARKLGVECALPAAHPFNPLALQRLLLACAADLATPNRYVCEAVLRHVWRGGAAADDAERLQALETQLAPRHEPRSDAVKQALRAATERATGRGVFGVPTIEVDGLMFWGLDALDMLAAYLGGDAWFDGAEWRGAGALPVGVQRRH